MAAEAFPGLDTPAHILLALFALLVVTGLVSIYLVLLVVAPQPRLPFPSEKTYLTSSSDGRAQRSLPCWYDRWLSKRQLALSENASDQVSMQDAADIEPASLEMTVVVPAYNEEKRILPALTEMVAYCDERFGRTPNRATPIPSGRRPHKKRALPAAAAAALGGYEIIIINDGSIDRTVDVVLDFAKEHHLDDILRVVTLEKNRGKGGGVTHGFRHARGEYVVFADADGASRFSDLGKLVEGCDDVVDGSNRGVAIGSRAHMVSSEAVVKVSSASFPISSESCLLTDFSALRDSQLPDAFLSLCPHDPDTAGDITHPRHSVRLQTL
jgi:dolichyl-phosphate beta-glucosyltransferase